MIRGLIFTFCLALPIGALAQGSIRDVDLKNFEYRPYCIGEEPDAVTVKDGSFSEEIDQDGWVERFYFSIFEITYGDLTGDGREEAVVLSVCNTGGTGNFSEGFIFGADGSGGARLLTRIPGGDRADGGLRTARVENRQLIIESNDPGELGGSCCPEFIITTRYRLAGERLVQIGEPTRRDIFPVERVKFPKGTSGVTFRVKLPADEGRRYIVQARGGQSLTVSTDSDDAGLRMLDDVEPVFGINNFLVRLPKSGDYTIEIKNYAAETRELLVNIKIQ
jgi:hypothetical protein